MWVLCFNSSVTHWVRLSKSVVLRSWRESTEKRSAVVEKRKAALHWRLNSLADQGFSSFRLNRPPHVPLMAHISVSQWFVFYCILHFWDNPAQCDQMGSETFWAVEDGGDISCRVRCCRVVHEHLHPLMFIQCERKYSRFRKVTRLKVDEVHLLRYCILQGAAVPLSSILHSIKNMISL